MVPHFAVERGVWWRRRLAGGFSRLHFAARSPARRRRHQLALPRKKRPKQSSCYIRRDKFRLVLLSFSEQRSPYADLGRALFDGDLEIMRHPRGKNRQNFSAELRP